MRRKVLGVLIEKNDRKSDGKKDAIFGRHTPESLVIHASSDLWAMKKEPEDSREVPACQHKARLAIFRPLLLLFALDPSLDGLFNDVFFLSPFDPSE